jgi:beta-N-acetylhexosaminidase
VADEAVTLLRDNGKLLPLQKGGTSSDESPYIPLGGSGRQLLAVVFTDDLRLDEGRILDRELKSRVPDAAVIYIDPHVAAGMTDSVLAAVDRAKAVVVAVYVNATSQGQVVMADGKAHRTIALPEAGSKLMNGILARAGDRTAVIAMGSPYLAAAFPDVQNYLCTYSVASVSEIAAAKALFGEISIHGHSPVTIPGIADRGAGLDRPIITSHQR